MKSQPIVNTASHLAGRGSWVKVGSGAAIVIPVGSADKTNTLSGLVTYINKQGLGVTASVITDSSGSRLALVSQTTGVAGQITITVNAPKSPL